MISAKYKVQLERLKEGKYLLNGKQTIFVRVSFKFLFLVSGTKNLRTQKDAHASWLLR